MTHDEHIADLRRLLAQCEAMPGDPVAQAIACGLRKSINPPPDTPFAARMRGLLSDYAVGIALDDPQRKREAVRAIRQAIASAMVPGNDATH